jgi:hypothetical protein
MHADARGAAPARRTSLRVIIVIIITPTLPLSSSIKHASCKATAVLNFSKPKRNEKRQRNNELRAMADETSASTNAECSDKKWNVKHDKLVEFEQKNGHCLVPCRHKEDAALGELEFVWRARSCTTSDHDVRGLGLVI